MGFAVQVRPRAAIPGSSPAAGGPVLRHREPAFSNVMSNRVLPAWAYVPWNLTMAFVLLGIAYLGGSGPVAVGSASGTGTARSASVCCSPAAPR